MRRFAERCPFWPIIYFDSLLRNVFYVSINLVEFSSHKTEVIEGTNERPQFFQWFAKELASASATFALLSELFGFSSYTISVEGMMGKVLNSPSSRQKITNFAVVYASNTYTSYAISHILKGVLVWIDSCSSLHC